LYGIIDLGYVEASEVTNVAEQMVEGGVDLIQLRGKVKLLDALAGYVARLHEFTSRVSTPLIANDHAEIARRLPVEGIHVGQDDAWMEAARRTGGRAIFIGKSTPRRDEELAAQREGADYLGYGPILATPTKPDYAPIGLTDNTPVPAEINLPIPCNGGINIEN